MSTDRGKTGILLMQPPFFFSRILLYLLVDVGLVISVSSYRFDMFADRKRS